MQRAWSILRRAISDFLDDDMVFFFGAEITEAYARENRSPIVPDETAERVPQSREDPKGARTSARGSR